MIEQLHILEDFVLCGVYHYLHANYLYVRTQAYPDWRIVAEYPTIKVTDCVE